MTNKAEQTQAIEKLRELLKPGSTVYTILRHVSKSGMTRDISLVTGESQDITYWVARAMGERINQDHGGIRVTGCGMDMGFNLVYNLGHVLFPKGFIPADAGKMLGRNGEHPNNLDCDGGYALNQRWL